MVLLNIRRKTLVISSMFMEGPKRHYRLMDLGTILVAAA
jgi:hypothetical protein